MLLGEAKQVATGLQLVHPPVATRVQYQLVCNRVAKTNSCNQIATMHQLQLGCNWDNNK
jgi:hypothetical protein